MIITATRKIPNQEVADFAWNRIAQFHNLNYTTEVLIKLHNLPKKHHSNAKKQSEQIRYCLLQAREYFDSAKAVSLATRPVLLYYCVMSLALAEILLKQDAESRLEKLRESHGAHGLSLLISSDPLPSDTFEEAASKLSANVQIGANKSPKGTFEVWRRSAREYPVAGNVQTLVSGGTLSSFSSLLIPADKEMSMPSSNKISLLDCVTNLPYLADVLGRWGSELQMIRSKVVRIVDQNNAGALPVLQITVHPSKSHLIDQFGNLVKAHSWLVNYIDIHEFPSGYVLSLRELNAPYHMELPHAVCISDEDVFFSCGDNQLGEFGNLYVSLNILGNFARYYPDKWMPNIEKNSAFANVVEELCANAFKRLPLLTLSELSRTYHVLEK